MDVELDIKKIYPIVQKANEIDSHYDFYQWLQNDISSLLSHDVLIACWGDFNSNAINYDIASILPSIETRKIISGCDLTPLISSFYTRWIDNNHSWFTLDNFDSIDKYQGLDSCLSKIYSSKSVLVYGMKDKRSDSECLYVFCGQLSNIEIDETILKFVMPYVDMALRRVECLRQEQDGEPETDTPEAIDLSDREHEIMSWVVAGKTNQEIGLILSISHNTVKNHLKRIFGKLGVSARSQAAALYIKMFNQRLA